MPGSRVVVLGGGTGGVVAARTLRRKLDSAHRVVIIDRDPTYRFAPSFLWVMTGARHAGQISADLGRLRREGIEVLTADVSGIDLAHRRLFTSDGPFGFDRLVIALGAELAPEALAGFTAAAHNVYTLPGAEAGGAALRRFAGGRVAVLVSSLPYKCPAAPYETAFLAEALLRRLRVRDRASIDVYSPEPLPMPTAGPVLGQAIAALLAGRGITFHPNQTIERIDPDAGELVLSAGQRAGYDLLLGVPPHRAPASVAGTGLAAPNGYLPVDSATLATAVDGVFAIGDVTTIPIGGGKVLPKAGVFAEAQAKVVANWIAAELAGRRTTAAFDGAGACFVELGDGRAGFARGNFYAAGGPQVRLRRPARHWHLAKVAVEKYWLSRWLGRSG